LAGRSSLGRRRAGGNKSCHPGESGGARRPIEAPGKGAEDMSDNLIRFEDGASYERMMGTWSRLAGNIFLDWLAPRSGLRWIDIGCGNGAFTELVVQRCAPAVIVGIDPAEGQLAFARTRPAARTAEFRQGDAMSLPFANGSFEAAVMALVIFYVPDPARGLAEMTRVIAPGGTVAAYIWDLARDGSPTSPILKEMRAIGLQPPAPPSIGASRLETLRELWSGAGLDEIETREITIERSFATFDDFWVTTLTMPNIGPILAELAPADVERLKADVQNRVPPDAAGRVTYSARANAIKGRVPN
jgi:ubiquinone/menaquinone biosynthesis C-methylase UbiE